MAVLYTYRAIWITGLAWLGLVALNPLLRGLPLVPGKIDPGQYWTIQIVIGLLMGACAHVVANIVRLLKKTSNTK